MKTKIILLLIVIASIAKQSFGQSDSTKQGKKSCENYYAPWHETIRDTSCKTVLNYGHYLSIGFGGGNNYSIAGISFLASYSLAYKSHLFSLSYGHGNGWDIFGNSPTYDANYLGLLVGESVRFKNLMLSISAGIAYSNISVDTVNANFSHRNIFNQQSISFPIEGKVFLHLYKEIGIGIYFSENIVTTIKYSPFSFGGSLVFGFWNKHKT